MNFFPLLAVGAGGARGALSPRGLSQQAVRGGLPQHPQVTKQRLVGSEMCIRDRIRSA